jgi:uncharacterized protein YbaP (TraB family)
MHPNGSIDTGVERLQEFNDRFVDAGRKASQLYLETTEKTLTALADVEAKLADASRVDWLSAVFTAHADLTRDLARVYASTGREILAK